ncbi:MAG: fimbria/pilus outer membrane usher protein [Deltaproteobacteria bacterium]|nr:fimbria/pilus outer membrane usher protein [Deltaproteobacteria bacterium]
MSIRRCAIPDIPLYERFRLLRPFAAFKRPALILCLFFGLFFAASPAFPSQQTVIVTVTVNSVARGEYFVILEDSGNVLVRTKDIIEMDFRDPKGRTRLIEGEEYLSLASMKGVAFRFDEKRIALDIDAAPELLLKRTIDFMPGRAPRVYYPRDTSVFLNYRLGYTGGEGMSYKSFGLTNQLGARWQDFLFLGDTSYYRTPQESRFTRLMTAVTYDDRTRLRRGVAGDFFASSGELGSNLNMGGVSFSKTYKLDPYFIKYPTLNLGGLASMPSDVEVYIDGIRLVSDKIAPGEFEIRNITHSGGAHNVEVVIRDPFGNVQRITHPFYQTDTLLGKGLSEYSYNAGYLRQEFGAKSWQYGVPAFSFFHRYGYNANLTLALRGEGGGKVYAAGPEASVLLASAGVLTVSGLAGRGRDGSTGAAASINHYYLSHGFTTRLLVRGYSRRFTTVASRAFQQKVRAEAAAGVGYGLGEYGNLSLDYALVKRYEGTDTRTVTASFSKSLWHTATAITTLKRVVEAEPRYEAFLGLVYYFGEDSSFSANYNRSKYTNAENLQLISPAPTVGEGVGLRASVDRIAAGGGAPAYIVNPTLDYNAAHAVARADYRNRNNQAGTDELYDISLAGAIARVDSTTELTRPIYDSFGMVKVGSVEGVRAYVNSQETGRTGKDGVVFIPSLGSFYDNRVSIEPKDIPMDYLLPDVRRTVSPPLRSGSCIVFDAKRIRAFMGKLKLEGPDGVKPLEFYDVTLTAGDRTLTFPTGKDGEFYFENTDIAKKAGGAVDGNAGCDAIDGKKAGAELAPGRYRATLVYNNRPCLFDIDIPDNDETFVELGGLTCTPAPEPVSLPAAVMPAAPVEVEAVAPIEVVAVTPVATSSEVEAVVPRAQAIEAQAAPVEVEAVAPAAPVEVILPSAPVGAIAPLAAVTPGPVVPQAATAAPAGPEAEPVGPRTSVEVSVTPGVPMTVPLPASFALHQFFNGDMPPTIDDLSVYYDAASAIKDTPGAVVYIEGHCDQLGTDAYNMRLGMRRARTAQKALIGLGVPAGRIVSVRSFGKRRPVCRTNLGQACRSLNRRVVIKLAAPPPVRARP